MWVCQCVRACVPILRCTQRPSRKSTEQSRPITAQICWCPMKRREEKRRGFHSFADTGCWHASTGWETRGNAGSDRRRQKWTDHNDKRMWLKLERQRMERNAGGWQRKWGVGVTLSDASCNASHDLYVTQLWALPPSPSLIHNCLTCLVVHTGFHKELITFLCCSWAVIF